MDKLLIIIDLLSEENDRLLNRLSADQMAQNDEFKSFYDYLFQHREIITNVIKELQHLRVSILKVISIFVYHSNIFLFLI